MPRGTCARGAKLRALQRAEALEGGGGGGELLAPTSQAEEEAQVIRIDIGAASATVAVKIPATMPVEGIVTVLLVVIAILTGARAAAGVRAALAVVVQS